MWGESKQARSATMAIVYITVGALLDVWSVIYYIYLARESAHPNMFLICYGLFGSGLVLMIIGMLVGPIGRVARPAEVIDAAPAQVVTSPVTTNTVAPPVVATAPPEPATAPPANSRPTPAPPQPPLRTMGS